MNALAAPLFDHKNRIVGVIGVLGRSEELDVAFDGSAAQAQKRMAGTAVNERWQAEMAPYFEDLDGARPDEGFRRIDEIFHLEDQLSRTEIDR